MDNQETNNGWRSDQYDFQFDLELPQHIPRAWERLPKSPHTTRHRGKKVWKRPEPRVGLAHGGDGCQDKNRLALSEQSTNTPRVVKRLRLKDEMGADNKSKENLFLATLKDTTVDTPKRKQRDVAILNFPHRPTPPQAEKYEEAKTADSTDPSTTDVTKLPNSLAVSTMKLTDDTTLIDTDIAYCSPRKQLQLIENDPVVDADRGTEEAEKLVGSISPSKKRGRPRKYPQSPLPRTTAQDQTTSVNIFSGKIADFVGDSGAFPLETSIQLVKSPSKKAPESSPRRTPGRPRKRPLSPLPVLVLAKVDEPQEYTEAGVETPHKATKDNETVGLLSASKLEPASKLESPMQFTPEAKATVVEALPTPITSLFNLDSPQIGTTLLRRESLRRRGSPSKRQSAKKGKSPQKKQLKKRDTLQEREILQKFTEGEKAEGEDTMKQSDEHNSAEVLEDALSPVVCVIHEATQDNEGVLQAGQAKLEEGNGEVPANADDWQETVDGDAANEKKESESTVSSEEGENENNVATSSCEAPKQEGDEAAESNTGGSDQAGIPVRKTRSGARFSDDTSMLKDFLSRAQASKAAKTVLSPTVAQDPKLPSARSPKKGKTGANVMKTNGQSSQKRARVQGTSPEKAKLEVTFGDDLEEETVAETEAEPAAIRRSARSRLPAPSKAQQNGPSLIPVRRGDGADPLVLQKTQAQELAIVTRANTRRNKGQARHPQYALKDLPTQEPELDESEKVTASNGKVVTWAETLASYQEGKEATDEQEEQRPKVRRLRGIGASNGTPAPKKKATAPTPSNGTPAPKRRGKTTG